MPCSDDRNIETTIKDGKSGRANETRAFNIETFNLLRLKRIEHHRKIEQERSQRNAFRRSLHRDLSSISQSPSRIVSCFSSDTCTSPIHTKQGHTFRISISDDCHQLSSRQELRRLGRRYASSQEMPMSTLTDETSSLDLTRSLDSKSRSSSSIDIMSLHDGAFLCGSRINGTIASNEGIGTHGMHYLLLARTNFLSGSTEETKYQESNEGSVVNDEDGSASESYSTPTPHLQIFMDEDGCNDHDETLKFDHFSSFCAALLLLSETEDKSSKVPMSQHESLLEVYQENFMRQWKGRHRSIKIFIKVCLIVIAGVAIFFCWRYTFRSTQCNARIPSIQSAKTIFMNEMDRLVSLREQLTPNSTFLVKLSWKNPIRSHTNWRQDFDLFPFIIESLYRLQKNYRYALRVASVAKYRMLDEAPAVAWNTTLAFATSLWRSNIMSEKRLIYTTHRSQPLHIWKSTLTSPVLFRSEDVILSNVLRNDTSCLFDDANIAKPPNESLFWRKPMKLPFVKHRSIPSFETGHENISIPISSSLTRLEEPNKRGYPCPLILLSRPRLTLDHPRINSIAISLDIRRNLVASMIIKRARPPRQSENMLAITTAKRDYYESSYPSHGQTEGKYVFDDVDVMNMAHEYIKRLLQRSKLN